MYVLYHDDNDITNNCHAVLLKMSTYWINIKRIDIWSQFMKLGILYDFVDFVLSLTLVSDLTKAHWSENGNMLKYKNS